MRIDWCDVPAGEVVLGTPVEDVDRLARDLAYLGVRRAWLEKETPRRVVPVRAFRIARTPVTVADWLEFRPGWRPDNHDGSPVRPDLPVSGIPWDDAAAYCAWVADRLGHPVHLPTEVQWERAARGDDACEFPWGDEYDPRRANLREFGAGGPIPVGSLPDGAGPFGTLDLAGNVDEWTSSRYSPYPGAASGVAAVENWAFDAHVTRGGAWFHSRDLARCARRHGAYEADLRGVGLRLAAGP